MVHYDSSSIDKKIHDRGEKIGTLAGVAIVLKITYVQKA